MSVTVPPLDEVVEHIHRVAGHTAPLIVGIEPGEHPGDPRIVAIVVPEHVGHPALPLIGRHVPRSWIAAGLVVRGRMHHLADDARREPGSAQRITVTMLATRSGDVLSVLQPEGDDARPTSEQPRGWVPDVLLRSLGAATPPPRESTGAWIDAQWLSALADRVLGQPGRRWSWRRLVELHPMWPGGADPTPAAMATRLREFAESHPWSWVREHAAPGWDGALRTPAPLELGGQQPFATWFDDGAISRWVMRELPPGGAVLQDLIDVLPTHVGDCLATALVDTTPGTTPESWC